MKRSRNERGSGAGVGIVGLAMASLAVFGVFDGIRSVGQNTNAKSLGDNVRVVFTGDFNPWEQTKDYFAPQGSRTGVYLTNNDDRAPLFDPSRDWDAGHISLAASFALFGALGKVRD